MSTTDDEVISLVTANPNLAVPHYLTNSYLYYVKGTSIITDETFDWLVKFLEEHWDGIEHQHKALLDREFLKSGFHIKGYPWRIVGAAERRARGA